MSEITVQPVDNLTVVAKYDLNKEIDEIIDQAEELIKRDPEFRRRYVGVEEVSLHADITL